jgi:NAD-dependent dihydropyrimidine dehydrogenase PreA subunit
MAQDIYEKLAHHLSTLGMGMPYREGLIEILRENFTPQEAEVALALPTKVAPLQPIGVDEIARRVNISRVELEEVLERLAKRGLLFSGKTGEGKEGYALQQSGYGFPQTFFWKGEDTTHARNMASLIVKYYDRQVTRESLAGSDRTKAMRYIPIGKVLTPDVQAVYPYHMVEKVIEQADVIALAHCPCRMTARLLGKSCEHPTEVCLKFDDIALYLIERGLAREIDKEEALDVIKKSEEAGLAHFVDNAVGDVKHICNCCGCACVNLSNFRRRKIPRDLLVDCYFIRFTDEEKCTGCGNCVEICPVDALTLQDDVPVIEEDWCVGCGVCALQCPTGAAMIQPRSDRTNQSPPSNFIELHGRILKDKGLSD